MVKTQTIPPQIQCICSVSASEIIFSYDFEAQGTAKNKVLYLLVFAL